MRSEAKAESLTEEPTAPTTEVVEEPAKATGVGEADVAKEEDSPEFDWSPLENAEILKVAKKFAKEVSKIPGVEFFPCKGKTPYFFAGMGIRKSLVTFHLSKAGCRLSVGQMNAEGKRKSIFYKIKEDGIYQDGAKVKIKDLLRLVKQYIEYRKWT